MEILEDIERNDTPEKLRHTPSGLLLVPQPSNDAADPLNWPLRKKVGILGLVSVCTWIGIAQTLANQSGFFAQAKVYHKAATEISYSVSHEASDFPRDFHVFLCPSGDDPLFFLPPFSSSRNITDMPLHGRHLLGSPGWQPVPSYGQS
jgi:hypothetical protein